jgi:AraC-like DNA-binding protein
MFFKEYLPPSGLKGMIKNYAVSRVEGKLLERVRMDVPPGLTNGLCFYFRQEYPLYQQTSKGRFRLPIGYVFPVCRESFFWEHQGGFDQLIVTFQPGKFRHLFGIVPEKFVDEVCSFEELGIKELDDLFGKLKAFEKDEDRICCLNAWFSEKKDAVYQKWDSIDEVIDCIHAVVGITVKEASGECYQSTRHFRRLFKRATGLPPKEYLRKIRLFRALHRLHENPHALIKQVAYQTGFSDPSHLTRECKAVLGRRPGELVKHYERFFKTYYWREESTSEPGQEDITAAPSE